ncbi:MAG: fibronectin type III domain-containing protein [Ignavibacteriales bacterium]|nr:fibronectin type III domain-containing protein [Ignavibacteriales bacterium]
MKKYFFLLICFVAVQWTYAQSTITINPGTSISIGTGSAVTAGYRDGTLTNAGTFNARSITFDPVATAATSVTQTSFNANWNSSVGATGYKLDVSTDPNFGTFVTGYQNLDVGNVITYSVSTNLSAGSTYYYRLRAYDIDGITGYSNVITVMMAPPNPVATAATGMTDLSFNANWNSITGATGYRLDVSTTIGFNAGTFVAGFENKDVDNVTAYSVTGLSGNSTYYYRIRAYNGSGVSSNSGTITVLTAPAASTATSASTITQTSFSANWDASAGSTGYRLDVATDAGFGAGTFVTGFQNLDVGNVITHSVNTSLLAGTTYYYRVKAYSASGTGSNSNTISLITIPPNPTTTAASNIQITSFNANWNASTGATKYYLDVSTDVGFGAGTYVTDYENKDVGNVSTFSVNTNLSGGTTYYYRVRANNAGGTSGNSGVITVLLIPPNPTAIAATAWTQTSFSANWDASTGAAKYYLDVSTNSGFAAGTFVTNYENRDVGGVTTFSVNTNLTAGTIYYYRVRANNISGTSGNSNTIDLVTIPPNPTAVAATSITEASFNANWNTSLSATGYRLDVSTDINFGIGNFVVGFLDKDVVGTSCSVTGLLANTTYYYRVRAYNGNGTSGNSGNITQLTAPAVPTATAATSITQTSFDANWDSSAGATGYRLDVSTDVGFGAGTFVTGYQNKDVGNVITFSVNTYLVEGSTYYYRVRAYSAGGTSTNSGTINLVTIPKAPIETEATAISTTSFDANWNSSASATGYRLDVSTSAGFGSFVSGYQNKDVGKVTTSSVNTNLVEGTTYYYRIRAYNTGGTSGNSGVITVSTVSTAPTANAATLIEPTRFTSNWSSVTGASGYTLDVSTDNLFGSFVTGYNNIDVGNVTSFEVTGLSRGITYYYRVRAYNVGGTSGNSNTRSVKTLSPAPIVTPATLITGTSFSANWNSATGATGYYLDVATDNIFTSFVAGFNNKDVSNVTTYSVPGLTAGNTYYYRVRTYNTSGTGMNSSTITVVTIPPAPVELAASSITNNSFAANWNSSVGAIGYYLDVATDIGFSSLVAGFSGKNIGDVTTYSVTGLSASTGYFYRVRAYNTGGTSDDSGNENPTTLANLVSIPAVTPASNIATTSFSANWNSVTGATKYYLDVSTVSDFSTFVTAWNNVDVGNVVTNSVSTNLTAGNIYYYRVRAFNASGTSGNSNKILVKTIPLAPAEQAASAVAATNFDANWSASTGATGYYLDVSTDVNFGGGNFVAGFNNRDVGNVVTYVVTGLTGSTPYYYHIRAYNTGGTSVNSGSINPTTLAGGTVIATAATTITGISFDANWNAYGGATGYRLDVSTDPGFGVGTFVIGYDDQDVNNVITFSVTGLSKGTNYYYRVKAYNGGGELGTSGTINVITLPDAPTATIASSVSEISFDANWNATTSATGYYIDVATDNGFTTFVTGFNNKYVNNVITYSITGLTGGTTYYYRVRAKNGSGTGESSSTITPLTVPHKPSTTFATALTNNSFSANWNSSIGATGYYLDVATDVGFTSFVVGFNNEDVLNVTSYSVTGLSGGTTYYYRIRAYNGSGVSNNSETFTALTLPSAPTSTSATSVAKTSFTANWNPSVGAIKYYLDVATTSNFTGGTYASGYQNLDVSSAVTFSVLGLTRGTTYYYRVRAFNSSGTSSNSDNQTVLTFPPDPNVLSATNIQSASFSANWNASTSATGYKLDVSTVSNFASFVGVYNDFDIGNFTTRSVSGLTAGNTYYYRVRSYNGSGTSDNSGTMIVLIAPAVPVATVATSLGEAGFSANWNSSNGADGYKIDVSTDVGFSSFVGGYNNRDVGSATTFSITGLNSGSTYYYQVRSYSGGRTSGNSNTITALTKPVAPVATAASSINESSFSTNWNSSTGAAKYYLDVATDNGFTSFVAGYNNKDVGNFTTSSVTGLAANTNYYYRLRSNNASGTSGNSGTINVLSAPAVPTTTAATSIINTSFNANWNSSAGAAGYRLDVSTFSNFISFVGIYNNSDVGNVTTYSVVGLSGSTTYYYRVRAYNGTGTSGNSTSINLTTAVDPSGVPTTNAATNIAQTSFSANWNAVAGAGGYRLDVSTDWNFGAGTFVTNFENRDVGNLTTYSVTGLTNGTTYYYRLRSYNVSGTSGNSGSRTVLTLPGTPTTTTATSLAATSFSANWDASTGATGYSLDVATDVGFTSFVAGFNNKDVSNVTTYSVTSLAGGTNYYYRVRAYNGSGASGNSGTITLLTLPSSPTATAATSLAETTFNANWNPVTGADGYRLDVSTDIGFGAGTFVSGYQDKDVVGGTTSVVSGLSGGTNYYYRVRAYNGSGTSTNSISITALTLSDVPTATAATSVGETSFSANWNPVTGVTKYYLDVSTDGGFGAGTFVAGYQDKDVSNVTTYSVTILSINTNYYYRVRSYNGSGTSGNSNTINVLTSPSAPTATSATSSGGSSFNSNWNTVINATKYYLDVSADAAFGAGSFETNYENKDVGNVTTFSVTDITGEITHYYRVRSSNGSGISDNSGTITVLGVPNATSATAVTQTSFSINWDPVISITGYRLDVSTDISFGAGTFVAGYQNKDVGNVTTFPISGLTPNSGYYYRVRSYDLSNTSGNSNTIIVKNLPVAPVAVNATIIKQSSFRANWNAPSGGASGYFIDVATDAGFVNYVTGYQNKVVYNVTSFVVNNIAAGTDYYYRVRAYNSWGNSDNSNIIMLITIPENPTAKAAINITSTSFTANWDDVIGANRYYLDIATDPGFSNMLDGYNNKNVANVTAFSITTVAKNTSFYYRIRSNNSTGTSSNSNTISLATLPNYAPITSGIEASPLDFTEGELPQQITATITVNDLDNLNLENAVIQITTNYQNGEDILSFTNQNGITGEWNSVNGSMTLNGTATLANYQTAIRDVKYKNVSNHPKKNVRTVNFTVNDGNINSNVSTREISITSINTPPVISNIESDPIEYKIKQSLYTLTNTIVVEDVDDDNNGSAIISITENYREGEDELVFNNQNQITGEWNSSKGILSLHGHGSVNNYQAALRTVSYRNNKIVPNKNNRTINITFNDGDDNSNSLFKGIKFTSGNIAPLLSDIEKSKINYSLNSDRVTVSDSIVISDSDDLFLQSGEVKIEEGFLVGEDVLQFEAPQNINALYNLATGTLTLSGQGDFATYQNIFRSVKYKNIKGTDATKSTKTVVFSVMDGSEKSNNATRLISVEGTVTDVKELSLGIPDEFQLYQNYPNPFNPTTTIRFAIPQQSKVKIIVYDVIGREVIKLVDSEKPPGYYESSFKAEYLPSGIYIYQIITDGFNQAKKMILLK